MGLTGKCGWVAALVPSLSPPNTPLGLEEEEERVRGKQNTTCLPPMSLASLHLFPASWDVQERITQQPLSLPPFQPQQHHKGSAGVPTVGVPFLSPFTPCLLLPSFLSPQGERSTLSREQTLAVLLCLQDLWADWSLQWLPCPAATTSLTDGLPTLLGANQTLPFPSLHLVLPRKLLP